MKNMIRILLLSFLCLPLNVLAQNFEVVQFYYDSATFKLNEPQKHILDSVIEHCSNRRILINGYADYLGSEHDLKNIAGNRASAVLRYMVDRGFPETQVISAMGIGQANPSTARVVQEDPLSRKVTLLITKGAYLKGKLKEAPPAAPPPMASVPKPKNVTDLDYTKLKKGDIVAIKNISFVPGTDNIMAESYDELDNLFNLLKDNPTLKVKIEGHVCCCIYPDGYEPDTPNWLLSEDRALKVKLFLVNEGISESRLSYAGYGRTKPIFPKEQTPGEEQANRRVEIRIVQK